MNRLVPNPLVVVKNGKGYIDCGSPSEGSGPNPTSGPMPRVPVSGREVPLTLALKTSRDYG